MIRHGFWLQPFAHSNKTFPVAQSHIGNERKKTISLDSLTDPKPEVKG
ncbi:MAG: hypothetical protein KJO79_08235 [Verrucomicrobiae bacterium]|nr:hypothetical protein [Verrucomicrobiae bacterium]NNJ87154.1 hypothetical protein [Akkermansiaceae bacterium]